MNNTSETSTENPVLIVDDVPDHLHLMSIFMRKAGYKVAEASSGAQALEIAQRVRPALIISDVSMPGLDGIELTRMIRSNNRLTETPILLVSAIRIGDDSARAGLREGADDYLEAPYDPTDFVGRAVRLLERSRSAAALKASEKEKAQALEDLRLKEEQFLLSQKLEAVGRLAGGIAHDFNNLLTVIEGYSQLTLQRLPDKEPLRGNIEEIKKASKRAGSLVSQLLAFSRKQLMQPKVFNLNSVVADLEKMLRRVIGENITLRTTLQADPGTIKADPSQVEQVIMNLVVNARDAMPSGGKLTIETATVYLDETYAREHIAVIPGAYIMLAVSDTGVGMDEDIRQQIFEPFFTTKEIGKGTGLGLSTVYGIVKQSGGNIWVYSEVGKGTTFKIYLPKVNGPAEEYEYSQAPNKAPGGNETILLVEDDEALRHLARDILETTGYRVLEAPNADAAFRICEQNPGIHLLLTDVVMPELGGPELAERLKALYPEMCVLYMSGYADDAIVHHGVLDGGTNFLAKPFSPNALGLKVRAVLGACNEKK